MIKNKKSRSVRIKEVTRDINPGFATNLKTVPKRPPPPPPIREEKCKNQANPYEYIEIRSVDEVLDMSSSYWSADEIRVFLKNEYSDKKPSVYMDFIPPGTIMTSGKWVFDTVCSKKDNNDDEEEEEEDDDPCCSYTIQTVSAVKKLNLTRIKLIDDLKKQRLTFQDQLDKLNEQLKQLKQGTKEYTAKTAEIAETTTKIDAITTEIMDLETAEIIEEKDPKFYNNYKPEKKNENDDDDDDEDEEDDHKKIPYYTGSNYDIFLTLEIPYSSGLTYGVYIKANTLKEKS